MNNKRGIAQAFSRSHGGVDLRPATVFDVFGISRVLNRSIHDLCAADHLGDPGRIDAWAANKDPESVRGWIVSGADLQVAAMDGDIAGVGGLRVPGEITLLYVDPGYGGRGIGTALLSRMEDVLCANGCAVARLHATRTAYEFYCARGWSPDGAPTQWHGIPQFPLRKSLYPSG